MMPKVFIGSSSERLDVAEALQYNLASHIKCELWTQGKFQLSLLLPESFENILDDYDFGIFVFVPDDKLKIRNEEFNAVRDNVLFELGLFIGRLGRKHCFLVVPENHPEFRLPTDLWGITAATYDHESDNLFAALGPACTKIKQAIGNAPPIDPIHVNKERIARMIEDERARTHLVDISEIHNELARDTKFNTNDNQMLNAFVSYPMTRYADALNDLRRKRSFCVRSYPRMQVAMAAISCSNDKVRAISVVRNDPWQYAGADSRFVQINIDAARRKLPIYRLYIVEDKEDIQRLMPTIEKKRAAGINLRYELKRQVEDSFERTFGLRNVLICDETVLSYSRKAPDHDGRLVYDKKVIIDYIQHFENIWEECKDIEDIQQNL